MKFHVVIICLWLVFVYVFIVHAFLSTKSYTRYDTHLICSDKHAYRKSHALCTLEQLDLFNVNVFYAIYPISKELNGYTCPLLKGQYGCILSHRTIWKNILKTSKDTNKWYFIFEDDIDLPENLKPYDIRRIIQRNLQQADSQGISVVYLGHCWKVLCTHAYAIKLPIIQKLYDNTYDCNKNKPKPIDVQMIQVITKLNIRVLYIDNYKQKYRNWSEGIIHQTGGSTINCKLNCE